MDICGKAVYGQIIHLDDVEVRQTETAPDGIEGLRTDWESEQPMEIYDLMGRRRAQLQKGINIVRCQDKTRKVFIK